MSLWHTQVVMCSHPSLNLQTKSLSLPLAASAVFFPSALFLPSPLTLALFITLIFWLWCLQISFRTGLSPAPPKLCTAWVCFVHCVSLLCSSTNVYQVKEWKNMSDEDGNEITIVDKLCGRRTTFLALENGAVWASNVRRQMAASLALPSTSVLLFCVGILVRPPVPGGSGRAWWRGPSLAQAPESVLLLLGLFSGYCSWFYLGFFGAYIVAAVKAWTRSDSCPQRSADFSKCKPSKALVIATWQRKGTGWGGEPSVSLTFREKVDFSDFKRLLSRWDNSEGVKMSTYLFKKKYRPCSQALVQCPASRGCLVM